MILLDGPVFDEAPLEDLTHFLRHRALDRFRIDPERLRIEHDGQRLRLLAVNGQVRDFPVRRSFLHKLLRWYSFPLSQLRRLSTETVASLANDYLLSIRSGPVTVTVEDGEALTITSSRYVTLPDLEVLRQIGGLGTLRVTRSDFFLRAYSDVLWKAEPIPGDSCGFGINVVNSETGFRALSVHSFILRYICSNGAVAPAGTGSRTYHTDRTPEAMAAALNEHIRQATSAFAPLAGRWPRMCRSIAAEEREQIRRRLSHLLSRNRADIVTEAQPGKETLYDLFNRITAEARQHPPGIRLELEELAGSLIPA